MALTTGAGKSDKIKERRKAIARAIEERKMREYKELNAVGKEKLEYEIGRLKNCILNCEHDLLMFPNNMQIINKIKAAKEKLIKKQHELNEVNDE